MKHKVWFWLGVTILAIGALGIYHGISTSVELGVLTSAIIIFVLNPFLILGAFFITHGLGKELSRPKLFWLGMSLLYIGLLMLLVASTATRVIYAAILSVWLIVPGIICISLGVRRRKSVSKAG